MEILTYFLCLLITRAACDLADISHNVESALLKHSVKYEPSKMNENTDGLRRINPRDISKSFDIFGLLNLHRALATPSGTKKVLKTQNTGKSRGYQDHEIPLYLNSKTESPDDNNGFLKPTEHHSTQRQQPEVDISHRLSKSIRNNTKRHLGEPVEIGAIKLSETHDSHTYIKEELQSFTELHVSKGIKSPQNHFSHLKQKPVQANTAWYIKNEFKLYPIYDFQPGVIDELLGPVRFGNAEDLQKPDGIIQVHGLVDRPSNSVSKLSHFGHERYIQRLFPFLPVHDALMPIQYDRVLRLRIPVSFGTTHNLQKPNDFNRASHHSSHTTSKQINPGHYFQRSFPLFPLRDVLVPNWSDHVTKLQKPVTFGYTRNLQKSDDVNKDHEGLTLHHIACSLPKHSHFNPELYIQRHFPLFPIQEVRKSIQINNMQKLRAPVGFQTIHDVPKPEDVNKIPNFRNHLHLSSNHESDHFHNLGHVPETVRMGDSQWPEVNEMDSNFRNHILGREGNVNLTNRRWESVNVHSSHKVQKRETVSDVSKNGEAQESHKRQSIIHEQNHDIGKPMVIVRQLRVIPSPNKEKYMQSNTSNGMTEIPKFLLTLDQNVIMQHDSVVNFQESAIANYAHVFKEDQLNSARNMRKPVQLNITDNIRRPVQPDSTHSIRKRSQHHPYHDIGQPVRLDSPRSLGEPFQLNSDHNIRQPVQLDSTHNLRKPVQVHQSHDLRRPVQLDPMHDLRTPVKGDPTHDLRKPVKLMQSHDLRWPVVEEQDHDMRNHIPEDDIFRSGYKYEELGEIIKEYIFKRSKKSFIDDKGLDLLSKLLYEDEYLLSKCGSDKLNFKHRRPSIGKKNEKTSMRLKSEYKKTFSESIKACGIPFNQLTDTLHKARKSTKWPWMVSLQQYIFNRFWHKCAGSLLNNLWVITAAHCVESRPKWDFLLQLGMDDPEDNKHYVERFVDRISIHPKFNILNLDHDIALLRMDSSVTFQPNISPICLSWKPDEIENKKAVALGWRMAPERSKTTDGSSQEKTVPVLTNKECEVMFSETGSSESIQKSFLCASFQKGRQDSCIGDSGGPLAIRDDNGKWLLAGLYSWGKTCATPNQPEVYIRTSRYSEWIEDTISCYEENISLL